MHMSLEDLCPDGFGPSIRDPLDHRGQASLNLLAMDARDPEDHPDRRWYWTFTGNEWRQVWHSLWRSLELTARSSRRATAGNDEPQAFFPPSSTDVRERKRKRSFNHEERGNDED